MIYAIWTHAFHLPGATTNQFSCDIFSNKRKLIRAIIDLLEESREPIIDLGMNDDEEFDATLEEYISMAEDPNIEDKDLTGESWWVGDMEITIHMAEPYPEVLDCFKDAISSASCSMSDDYDEDEEDEVEDVDEEDDYADAENRISIYRAIDSIGKNTSEEQFREIFCKCSSLFDEWETF